jgi:hypothetical protein
MASAHFSTYLSAKLLDLVVGNATYTAETLYMALSIADPLEDGSGLSEPAGGAYVRKSISASDFAAATGDPSELLNTAAITFVEADAPWGDCTHFAICNDSATAGGNVLMSAQLDTMKSPTAGDTPRFSIGSLSITLT